MGPKIEEMKELVNASNSDELIRENKKLKEQMALMKSQIDYKDKMLKANEMLLKGKDSIIDAKECAIRAKDEEINLLRKKIKEYENFNYKK